MNKGFFFAEEVKEKKRKYIPGSPKKKRKTKEIDLCEKCGLYKNCINPKMEYTGKGKKEILIIGEAPGATEDEKNKQFIGKSGQLLRESFKKYSVDFEEDCWITNSIICRPERNKTPTNAQVNYCRRNLKKTVELLKPKKILTFGKIALQGLIGDKTSVTSINEWVGWKIPDQDYQCYIFPNFHPQYLNYNKGDVVLERKFNNFLLQALKWSKKFKYIKDNIDIKICDSEEAKKLLYNLDSLKESTIAIDYETSGLKPHKKNHFIKCCSITDENLFTFVFLLDDNTIPFLNNILRNKRIRKVFHNLQFEYKWTKQILGVNIKNIWFDTQLSTHILDNRPNITSLKFQVYVNYGIVGYEKSVEKYLNSTTRGGNEYNTIYDCPIEDLMRYNGYDTYFTMLLYNDHSKKLDNHLEKGFSLFLDGNITLSRLSGIRFDREVYSSHYKDLTDNISAINEEIMNSREVNKLENKEDFNYNSSKQLRDLLYEACGWKTENRTTSGLKSVNEETLQSFDRKLTNNILKVRKMEKIRDTYLAQFIREAVLIEDNYYIFPFFSLNIPRTYRSSSQFPNFQNIPVRDKYARNITRSCLVPSRGNQLLEIDFKGMEVAMSCCYHQDPVMISYVENSKNDMHRDIAMDLFLKTEESLTKYERYCGKNGFVFPAFYGSTCRMWNNSLKGRGFGEITGNLWEMMKEETREHLAKNGLSDVFYFQEHVEQIEDKFWNERFKIYQEWKKSNWEFYQENGYVELKTGFRCSSLMSYNDVNNYPIQGSAFHVLLWCLIRFENYLRRNNMKTRIIGQIHDSLVLDLFPSELNHLIGVMKKISSKDVREHWEWINVPMTIEAEITDIDQSWNTKKELEI